MFQESVLKGKVTSNNEDIHHDDNEGKMSIRSSNHVLRDDDIGDDKQQKQLDEVEGEVEFQIERGTAKVNPLTENEDKYNNDYRNDENTEVCRKLITDLIIDVVKKYKEAIVGMRQMTVGKMTKDVEGEREEGKCRKENSGRTGTN